MPSGLVLKNAAVTIGNASSSGTTDFSGACRRVRISETYDLLDDTRMGLNSHSRIAGLIDWRVEVELLQNFATTVPPAVDKLIAAIYNYAQPVPITIRPVNAGRTSDNPEYSGMVILETFNPIDAAVGALQTVTATFRSAGDLSRVVTSSG